DGYWAYLTHPAHVRSELEGIPLIEKFAAMDVSDSDDPDLGEKIAALQARNFEEHPEVAAVGAQAASFTVADGSGSAGLGAPSQPDAWTCGTTTSICWPITTSTAGRDSSWPCRKSTATSSSTSPGSGTRDGASWR